MLDLDHIRIVPIVGCIGHVTIRDTGEACKTCSSRNVCAKLIEKRQENFFKALDEQSDSKGKPLGDQYRRKPRKKAAAAPSKPATATPFRIDNPAAKATLAKLNKRGVDLNLIKRGINPVVTTGPAWLTIAIRELLKGPQSIKAMVEAIRVGLNVTPINAMNKVNAARAILEPHGIITMRDDIMEILP